MNLRRAEDRGFADHGWLKTFHTFSFADYYDPAHMGYRTLRVINDDRVAPGQGFGTHPHKDMEIVTYVLEGALAHRDSMGNSSVIRAGEVQRMTAGTGVRHSEFNASQTEAVHLLQIWVLPNKKDLQPGYEQRLVPAADKRGKLALIAAGEGMGGLVTIHQDARILAGELKKGEKATHALENGRHAWVHVAQGKMRVNGVPLGAGDGASLDGGEIVLEGEGGEVLVFDLA